MKTYKYRLNNILSDTIVKVISKSNSNIKRVLINSNYSSDVYKGIVDDVIIQKISNETEMYNLNNDFKTAFEKYKLDSKYKYSELIHEKNATDILHAYKYCDNIGISNIKHNIYYTNVGKNNGIIALGQVSIPKEEMLQYCDINDGILTYNGIRDYQNNEFVLIPSIYYLSYAENIIQEYEVVVESYYDSNFSVKSYNNWLLYYTINKSNSYAYLNIKYKPSINNPSHKLNAKFSLYFDNLPEGYTGENSLSTNVIQLEPNTDNFVSFPLSRIINISNDSTITRFYSSLVLE